MDEDEITEDVTGQPMRHDKWSVLILAVNAAAGITQVVANTLEGYTVMIAQHANQVMYDRKFEKITKEF